MVARFLTARQPRRGGNLFGATLVAGLLAALAAAPAVPAADPAAAGGGTPEWLLVPEARFMGHDIAWPIGGSVRTVLVPERRGSPLTLADTRDPHLALADLRRLARDNAGRLFDTLEPELARDARGVILYAVLSSPDPSLPACVLAPGFADRFFETIGPDLQIAIPNRNRIYIFPRSAVPAAELSDRVFVDYRASDYPVSREIFELSGDGLRAVGEFR